jgi:hypothetical protein
MIRFEGTPEELEEIRQQWAREAGRRAAMDAQILGITYQYQAAMGEEPPSPAEQRVLQRASTDCPVVLMLESLCADVRSRRDAGASCEILQAPECDSFNVWRAQIKLGPHVRGIHWAQFDDSIEGTWGWDT